jgi:hypothetical protein
MKAQVMQFSREGGDAHPRPGARFGPRTPAPGGLRSWRRKLPKESEGR